MYICIYVTDLLHIFYVITAELPSIVLGEMHSPVLIHLEIALSCFSMAQKYM